MPASSNKQKKIGIEDLLADIKRREAEAEVGESGTGALPQYIFTFPDELEVSDDVEMNPNRDTLAQAETVNVSDAVTNTEYTFFRFTNAAESLGNLRWSMGAFTDSTGVLVPGASGGSFDSASFDGGSFDA